MIRQRVVVHKIVHMESRTMNKEDNNTSAYSVRYKVHNIGNNDVEEANKLIDRGQIIAIDNLEGYFEDCPSTVPFIKAIAEDSGFRYNCFTHNKGYQQKKIIWPEEYYYFVLYEESIFIVRKATIGRYMLNNEVFYYECDPYVEIRIDFSFILS